MIQLISIPENFPIKTSIESPNDNFSCTSINRGIIAIRYGVFQEVPMDKLVTACASLGIKLESHQVEQFEIYYRELIDWNQRINLTAITDYGEVQIKHFADSLTILPALKQYPGKSVHRVIDIGAGAGFPGLPLKIAIPELHMSLLEATGKKVRFLRHIVRKLKLEGVDILSGRAEDIGHRAEYRETFDLVLSRAVASLPALVELAIPFCAIGGGFIAQKQAEAKLEIKQAQNAVRILGGELREVIDITLPYFPGDRCLVVYNKVSQTPSIYPRHSGVPAKKPLR